MSKPEQVFHNVGLGVNGPASTVEYTWQRDIRAATEAIKALTKALEAVDLCPNCNTMKHLENGFCGRCGAADMPEYFAWKDSLDKLTGGKDE